MQENWIKVEEIEYTHKDLSKIYEKIDDNNEQKLEELIKNNIWLQELKRNLIPYKCKWTEKIVQKQVEIRSTWKGKEYRYYVEIFIPESYKEKYNNILKNIENSQSLNCYEGIPELEDIEEEDSVYEPSEKASKALKIMVNGMLIITGLVFAYFIVQSILYI